MLNLVTDVREFVAVPLASVRKGGTQVSDIQLFRLSGDDAAELPGRTAVVEEYLQALVESQMQTFLGVGFLASQ